MRTALILALTASLCTALACTPGPGPGPDPTDRTAYPEGPYGTAEGDIFEPYEMITDTGGEFSFNTDVFADEGNRLMLLTAAAGWCTACFEEQPVLEQFHQDHEAEGLVTIVTVFQDDQFQPAEPDDAAAWRVQHGLTLPVLTDVNNEIGAFYEGSPPVNMFIEIDTMEILQVQVGWDPGVVEAVIEARLQ